ncbi:MATE family efflux transporter [Pseudahrensia aquimaris]|uniref:MATE family efflux transporter n=1 Tax=Pseudahrensia aquimaris TaxID=744461 RepID=A0ABW3FCC6_9HYPH
MSAATAVERGKFLTGSTMRHVIVMTLTASAGLVSVFFIDALNLFYISLLGQQALAAAVGYATTILFFSFSIGIGMSISASALVSRAIGAGETERSRKMATTALIYLAVAMVVFSTLLFFTRHATLAMIGAQGEALEMAARFMAIVIPSIPLVGFGMCFGALLRSKGDAKRAMYVTLSGAAAAMVLDPLLIFGFDMGLDGAAYATVLSRLVIVAVGLHGVHKVHNMLGRPDAEDFIGHLRPFMGIALPALTTQMATPVGNAYVTGAIAEFGDDAVAGWAIVGRLIPVAFGVIFALSGAVGPILGQNYGAKDYPRVLQSMKDAFVFTLVFCLSVWLLLALGKDGIIWLFGASGEAADIISIFCLWGAGTFVFAGALFVANAAFNNLGKPLLATAYNWGRATLGTIPFVYFGMAWGAEGVIIGWSLGAVVFGGLGVLSAYRLVKNLPETDGGGPIDPPTHLPPSANSPFTTAKGATTG